MDCLNRHFSYQPTPILQNTNQLFQNCNQVISLHPNNFVEHWTSHIVFVENRLVEPLQVEKHRRCRLFLRVAATAAICIFSRYYCWTIAFVTSLDMYDWFHCENASSKHCLNFRNIAIRCEAKFSKVQLEIFKYTWVKCLIETNLASSVKPRIIIIFNIQYKLKYLLS